MTILAVILVAVVCIEIGFLLGFAVHSVKIHQPYVKKTEEVLAEVLASTLNTITLLEDAKALLPETKPDGSVLSPIQPL